MDGARSKGSTFRNILPVALILVPLVIHFVLIGCTLVSESWLPSTFWFSHLVFLAVGLWTLHDRKSLLPVVVFITVLVATAVLDIIQLGLYFDGDFGRSLSSRERLYQFSAGMCIINLVLKVVTGILAGVTLCLRKSQSDHSNYGPQTTPGYTITPGYATRPGPMTTPGLGTKPVPTTAPGFGSEPVPTTAPGYGAKPGPTTTPGYGIEPAHTTAPGYGTEPGYSTWPAYATSEGQFVDSGDHPVPVVPAHDDRHASH